MNAIRDLTFDIQARDQASQTFARVRGNLEGVRSSLISMKGALGAAFGGASVAAIVGLATEANKFADRIGKVAKSVGVSAEALQEYRAVADLAGIEQDQLDTGLQRFTRNLGELRAGTGTLDTFLKRFDEGFATALKGATSTDEALALFFARLEETSGAADRAALAAAGFGRAGVDMVNIVEGGTKSIAVLREEMRAAGAIMGGDVVRDAELMNDEFSTAQKIIDTQFKTALLSLTGPILAVTKFIADLSVGVADFVDKFKEADSLSLRGLEMRLAALNEQRDALLGRPGAITHRGLTIGLDEEIAKVQDLIAARKAAAEARKAGAPGGALGAPAADLSDPLFDEEKKQAEAAAKLLDKNKEAVRLLTLHNSQQEQLISAQRQGAEAAKALKIEIDLENETIKENIALGSSQGKEFANAFRESKRLEQAMSDLTAEQQRSKQIAGELDDAFDQFLGNAISGVTSLKDAVKLFARDAIAALARTAFFGTGGGDKPSLFAGAVKALGFAGGGIATPFGPAAMPRFAGGGVARTASVFGEDGPEAAVPLPDGRRIPVELRGGGGGVVVNNFIDARGAEIGVEERIEAVLARRRPEMISAAVAESEKRLSFLADAGGRTAKTFGRR